MPASKNQLTYEEILFLAEVSCKLFSVNHKYIIIAEKKTKFALEWTKISRRKEVKYVWSIFRWCKLVNCFQVGDFFNAFFPVWLIELFHAMHFIRLDLLQTEIYDLIRLCHCNIFLWNNKIFFFRWQSRKVK